MQYDLRIMIEVKRIRQALALAQHRNFARAAKALFMTQPALTRSIQVLEEELGAKLFDRRPRDVVPTAFGQLLLERGESVVLAVRDLQREIDRMKGLEVGSLVVGAGLGYLDAYLGPTIARMLADHPGLRMRAVESSWHGLTGSLRSGEIELFVADAREAEEDDGLDVIRLTKTPVVFFGRRGHPLCRRRRPTLVDVLKYPLVAPQVPASIKGRLRAAMRKAHGRDDFLSVECEGFHAIKAIVAQSDAIGGSALGSIAHDPQFEMVQLRLPWMQTLGGIVSLANRTLSPAAGAFIEHASKVDRELQALSKRSA